MHRQRIRGRAAAAGTLWGDPTYALTQAGPGAAAWMVPATALRLHSRIGSRVWGSDAAGGHN